MACLLIAFGSRGWAAVPCTPAFALETGEMHGWLGADGAYSIPLKHGRDLWIFGDTLEGRQRTVENGAPKMVRNSIGLSTCNADGTWKIRYYIRHDAKGAPQDFFTSRHQETWYWAMDGFRSGADVWVTLLCVRATDAKSALGFATCGSDLAKISAPGPDPQQWKITYFPLVANGVGAYPSATVATDGNNVDLFAVNELEKSLIAGRIAKKGFNNPQANLEYLAANGEWKPGFDSKDARTVMTQATSELSIRYHPDLKRWLAIMFAPGMFSSELVLLSAPSATGPWSQDKPIYRVPEMRPEIPGYDKDTFCYAGKEHPEFERGDLVFTYVCNTFATPKLATEVNIYFPQTVRMPMLLP
jgi:hypothetical protein